MRSLLTRFNSNLYFLMFVPGPSPIFVHKKVFLSWVGLVSENIIVMNLEKTHQMLIKLALFSSRALAEMHSRPFNISSYRSGSIEFPPVHFWKGAGTFLHAARCVFGSIDFNIIASKTHENRMYMHFWCISCMTTGTYS